MNLVAKTCLLGAEALESEYICDEVRSSTNAVFCGGCEVAREEANHKNCGAIPKILNSQLGENNELAGIDDQAMSELLDFIINKAPISSKFKIKPKFGHFLADSARRES